jgi:predicted unusual protein kinase regulating ubiquinone biosynthesis (AarF/ABC1/UbiB family)
VYDERCSKRILAMECVTGEKVTNDDAFSGVDVTPHEMATRITEVYLEMGLSHGVFHADPHPGNLAVTEGGRLLLYDFGMSERLSSTTQDDIVDLYRALVARDVEGLIDALVALDVLEPSVDRVAVRGVLELVIENLEGRSDVTWREIITELTSMLREFPFRLPPNVMLLVRVGTVGEGVCRQLDPEFDFLAAVRSFLLEQGFIESPLEALLEETVMDARGSIPALARVPTRLDRSLEQLERGELVVRTRSVETQPALDPHLGYALLAGALIVSGAILTFNDSVNETPIVGLAVIFLVLYLLRRR